MSGSGGVGTFGLGSTLRGLTINFNRPELQAPETLKPWTVLYSVHRALVLLQSC